MGKEKIIVDVPAEVKEKLKELSFQNRTNMTNMIIQLIEAAKLNNEK